MRLDNSLFTVLPFMFLNFSLRTVSLLSSFNSTMLLVIMSRLLSSSQRLSSPLISYFWKRCRVFLYSKSTPHIQNHLDLHGVVVTSPSVVSVGICRIFHKRITTIHLFWRSQCLVRSCQPLFDNTDMLSRCTSGLLFWLAELNVCILFLLHHLCLRVELSG